MRSRLVCSLALASCVLVLNACGDVHREVQVSPKEQVTTTTVQRYGVGETAGAERWLAVGRLNAVAQMVTAAKKSEALAGHSASAYKGGEANAAASRGYAPPANDHIASAGSCYDQPWIPAYIVTRESGGDPYIVNGGSHAPSPYLSGGRSWGCFQFMPGTWASSCGDLGFDVASQIECARRVSNNGTNLKPWSL